MSAVIQTLASLVRQFPRGYSPILRALATFDESLQRLPIRLKYANREFVVDLRENVCIPLFKYGCYPYQEAESQILLDTIRSEDVFYDVGANIGYISFILRHSDSPPTEIHSFEPAPRAIRLIRKNFSGNEGFHLEQVVVGESPGTVKFKEKASLNLSAVGTTSGGAKGTTISRRKTSLDSYVDEHSPPSYLKVDVEGYEPEVLQGAQRTISEHLPIILFEALNEKAFDECHDIIFSCGDYEIYGVQKPRTHSVQADSFSDPPQPSIVAPRKSKRTTNNYFAVPTRLTARFRKCFV